MCLSAIMSFANFDYEAQKPLSKRLNADQPPLKESSTELDRIIDKTSTQLQIFGGLVSQFDSQRRLIGSKRDSTHLRDNINELTKKISDLDTAIQSLILNISQLINKKLNKPQQTTSDGNPGSRLDISNRQIVIKERLVAEFNELHKGFQNSIRQYQEKKLACPIKTIVPSEITESTPLISGNSQQQTQMQIEDQDQINETELQYHLMLTEERNREITQVTEGILEVNAIFKDLGELVTQQGEQLDTIEDNIFQLHGNVQQADKELRKADEYQRSKGKWSCILLVALCIFVLIIVLAVLS